MARPAGASASAPGSRTSRQAPGGPCRLRARCAETQAGPRPPKASGTRLGSGAMRQRVTAAQGAGSGEGRSNRPIPPPARAAKERRRVAVRASGKGVATSPSTADSPLHFRASSITSRASSALRTRTRISAPSGSPASSAPGP